MSHNLYVGAEVMSESGQLYTIEGFRYDGPDRQLAFCSRDNQPAIFLATESLRLLEQVPRPGDIVTIVSPSIYLPDLIGQRAMVVMKYKGLDEDGCLTYVIKLSPELGYKYEVNQTASIKEIRKEIPLTSEDAQRIQQLLTQILSL